MIVLELPLSLGSLGSSPDKGRSNNEDFPKENLHQLFTLHSYLFTPKKTPSFITRRGLSEAALIWRMRG